MLAISDSGISEFQPSISPDGTKVCYTQSNNGFNNTADVLVAPITTPPSGGIIVSKDLALGDYNCTFSPDGTLVAYVNWHLLDGPAGDGPRGQHEPLCDRTRPGSGCGQLRRQPGLGARRAAALPRHHGGHDPQHARDLHGHLHGHRPAYEQTDVLEFNGTDPANGTLTQDQAGQPFTYTPNQGFTGTDSFEVRSFDGLGFGTDRGTVTITVGRRHLLLAASVPGGTQPLWEPPAMTRSTARAALT